uniref:histidine phosphatase family protein n=1 Tax=Derxia lacustris TaxID=764842 RepID=UPI000A172E13
MTGRLILARHARPRVEPGLCYGRLDVPADPVATQVAAQALADFVPPGLPVRVSSRLRARQLADALHALRPDLVPQIDARFDEMDFGCHEGRRWADIPRAAVDAWVADFAWHRFGGVESAQEVVARVAAGLRA